MIKREQKFQTLFNHYIKNVFLSKHEGGFAFELKHTRGKSYINFKEIKEHQIQALYNVKHGILVYKLDDSGFGQKPFDSIAFKNCNAFIVIKYPLGWVMLDIDVFLLEKKNCNRKSLTWEKSLELSTLHTISK